MSPRRLVPLPALAFTLAFGPSPAAAQAGSPAGAVPVERLQARRQALIARIKTGVAMIKGASELSNDPPESDYPQAADFRQDNDFFYFTGLETRDSWLVFVATDSLHGEVHLFLPPRNPAEERWTGPKLGPGAEAAQATGIPVANIHSADSVDAFLERVVFQTGRGSAQLWFRHTRRDAESEPVRTAALRAFGTVTHDLLPVLATLRVVKDEDEIRRLTRAVEISAEGHLAAMRAAKPGGYEYEVEAAAEYTFRKLGAERLGYPSIVGSGFNSTVLHYDANRRRLEDGDLIVMDMGAEFGYYTADVTRTIPANGKFSARQRAIYELVLGAQQAALDAIKPGIRLGELDRVARTYIADHSGNLCGSEGCGRYFIHGLSHWIGMDVHDLGGGVPLAPGMTFTVEPGIYLPAESLGVRIEDDVLVTGSGYLLLSRRAPRTVEEVERAMAGKG